MDCANIVEGDNPDSTGGPVGSEDATDDVTGQTDLELTRSLAELFEQNPHMLGASEESLSMDAFREMRIPGYPYTEERKVTSRPPDGIGQGKPYLSTATGILPKRHSARIKASSSEDETPAGQKKGGGTALASDLFMSTREEKTNQKPTTPKKKGSRNKTPPRSKTPTRSIEVDSSQHTKSPRHHAAMSMGRIRNMIQNDEDEEDSEAYLNPAEEANARRKDGAMSEVEKKSFLNTDNSEDSDYVPSEEERKKVTPTRRLRSKSVSQSRPQTPVRGGWEPRRSSRPTTPVSASRQSPRELRSRSRPSTPAPAPQDFSPEKVTSSRFSPFRTTKRDKKGTRRLYSPAKSTPVRPPQSDEILEISDGESIDLHMDVSPETSPAPSGMNLSQLSSPAAVTNNAKEGTDADDVTPDVRAPEPDPPPSPQQEAVCASTSTDQSDVTSSPTQHPEITSTMTTAPIDPALLAPELDVSSSMTSQCMPTTSQFSDANLEIMAAIMQDLVTNDSPLSAALCDVSAYPEPDEPDSPPHSDTTSYVTSDSLDDELPDIPGDSSTTKSVTPTAASTSHMTSESAAINQRPESQEPPERPAQAGTPLPDLSAVQPMGPVPAAELSTMIHDMSGTFDDVEAVLKTHTAPQCINRFTDQAGYQRHLREGPDGQTAGGDVNESAVSDVTDESDDGAACEPAAVERLVETLKEAAEPLPAPVTDTPLRERIGMTKALFTKATDEPATKTAKSKDAEKTAQQEDEDSDVIFVKTTQMKRVKKKKNKKKTGQENAESTSTGASPARKVILPGVSKKIGQMMKKKKQTDADCNNNTEGATKSKKTRPNGETNDDCTSVKKKKKKRPAVTENNGVTQDGAPAESTSAPTEGEAEPPAPELTQEQIEEQKIKAVREKHLQKQQAEEERQDPTYTPSRAEPEFDDVTEERRGRGRCRGSGRGRGKRKRPEPQPVYYAQPGQPLKMPAYFVSDDTGQQVKGQRGQDKRGQGQSNRGHNTKPVPQQQWPVFIPGDNDVSNQPDDVSDGAPPPPTPPRKRKKDGEFLRPPTPRPIDKTRRDTSTTSVSNSPMQKRRKSTAAGSQEVTSSADKFIDLTEDQTHKEPEKQEKKKEPEKKEYVIVLDGDAVVMEIVDSEDEAKSTPETPETQSPNCSVEYVTPVWAGQDAETKDASRKRKRGEGQKGQEAGTGEAAGAETNGVDEQARDVTVPPMPKLTPCTSYDDRPAEASTPVDTPVNIMNYLADVMWLINKLKDKVECDDVTNVYTAEEVEAIAEETRVQLEQEALEAQVLRDAEITRGAATDTDTSILAGQYFESDDQSNIQIERSFSLADRDERVTDTEAEEGADFINITPLMEEAEAEEDVDVTTVDELANTSPGSGEVTPRRRSQGSASRESSPGSTRRRLFKSEPPEQVEELEDVVDVDAVTVKEEPRREYQYPEHNPEGTHHCVACKFRHNDLEDYYKHMDVHMVPLPDPWLEHQCRRCQKKLKSKYGYHLHIIECNNQRY